MSSATLKIPSWLSWLLPVVFSAGTLAATIVTVAKATEKIEARIEQHVAAPGHPVSDERIKALNESLERNERMLERLGEQAERVDDNVLSLCLSTPGANCKR
jgi:hypothetical protein